MAKTIDGGRIVFTIDENGSLVQLGKLADIAGKKVGKQGLGKNVQETDRLYKSLSHQTSNSTKEFAKQAQTMQGGLVAAYAIIAAQVFAVSAAFRFLEDAMNTRNLIEGQKMFGAITGNAFASITTSVQNATAGMLKFNDAAQAVAIGTASGLSAGQLERLADAAKNTSLALGRDLTDSFNRLIRGTTKAEPELLDELGIVLRLDPALRNYAQAVGKSVKELTAFERTQAVANEVLDQAERKFGRITELMDPEAFALQQFTKEFDDLVKGFKTGVAGVMIPIVNFLKENVLALTAAVFAFTRPILMSVINLDGFANKAQAAFTRASLAAGEATIAVQRYTAAIAKANATSAGDLISRSMDSLGVSGVKVKEFKAGEGQLSQRQIDAYRRYLEGGTKGVGKLKGETRASFIAFLDDQEAALTGSLSKQNRLFKSFGLQVKKVFATMQLDYAKTLMFMQKGTEKAIAFINGAFKWIGRLAYAYLIYEIGKAIYEMFVPVNEAAERAKEKTKALNDELVTLREELQRMGKIQDMAIMSLPDLVVQTGQALQSYDLSKKIRDFNLELEKGMSDETRANFVNTAVEIENLDAGFTKLGKEATSLSDLFKGGVISQTAAKDALNYANAVQEASMASKRLADNSKAVKAALANITGTGKIPYSDLLYTLELSIKDLELMQGRMNNLQGEVAARGTTSVARASALTGAATEADVRAALKGADASQIEEIFKLRTGYEAGGAIKSQISEFARTGNLSSELIAFFTAVTKGSQQHLTDLGHMMADEEEYYNNIQKDVEAHNTELKKQRAIRKGFLKLQIEGLELQRQGIALSAKEAKIRMEGPGYRDAYKKQAMDKEKSLLKEAEIRLKIKEQAEKYIHAQQDEKAGILATIQNLSDQLFLQQDLTKEVEKRFEIAKKTYEFEQLQKQDKLDAVKGNLLMGSAMGQRMMAFAQSDAAKGIKEKEGVQGVIDAAIAQERMNIELETTLAIGARLTDGFASDFANALVGVAEGTKTLKEAFGDMARSIIADITKMVIKALILEAILAAIKMMSGGTSGPVADFFTKALGGRDGGIMSSPGYRSFSDGGVTSGPQSGYPATLHGTEAVVPLPNNRSIPVEMKGGMGNVNNVNVNIDMQNGSSNITADQGNAFGAAISAAVIDEIAKQQRSGGLLSGT